MASATSALAYPNPGYGSAPGSNQYSPYSGSSGSYMPGNTPMPVNYGSYSGPYGGGYAPFGSGYNPYQVPQQGGTGPGQPGYFPWGTADPGYGGAARQGRTTNPGSENLGHGIIATGLQYPGLSQDFANYLMSQVGAGVTPFDLSTMLPGGGQTAPGQLTAGLDPLLQNLMQFYQGGQSNLPGANTLSNIAQNGISALPEWQAMMAAQQQNIQQNYANLKEQYGSTGNLAGSAAATGLSDYAQQTTLDQNALLAQLQQQNILQGQIPVAQGLFQGGTQFGTGLQALNQQAIQNQLQEFMRTSPQNNPLLQYIGGLSTLYPPTTKTPTGFEQFTSLLSALSGSGFSTSSGGASGGATSIAF